MELKNTRPADPGVVCHERKRLVELYQSEQARVAALTASYDARPPAVAAGVPLASLLDARVAYNEAGKAPVAKSIKGGTIIDHESPLERR